MWLVACEKSKNTPKPAKTSQNRTPGVCPHPTDVACVKKCEKHAKTRQNTPKRGASDFCPRSEARRSPPARLAWSWQSVKGASPSQRLATLGAIFIRNLRYRFAIFIQPNLLIPCLDLARCLSDLPSLLNTTYALPHISPRNVTGMAVMNVAYAYRYNFASDVVSQGNGLGLRLVAASPIRISSRAGFSTPGKSPISC